MKERPILVTGGSGFLGGRLVSAFAEHYDTYYTYFSHPVQELAGAMGVQADVSDYRMISELIEKVNPRVILHTAALTDFNRCASDPNEAYKVNVQGSENIARCAARLNSRLVLFSTDMVFDGTKSFSTENDIPLPCCTYGKTKLAAEQTSARALDNLLSIRLSLIYGNSLTLSKCHAEELVKKLINGQNVPVFTNEFRTPIYVQDIVDILLTLAFCDDVRGILHLGGPDRLSRYELGTIMVRLLSLPDDRLVPVSSERDVRFLEPRPKDCSLQSLRLPNWWHRPLTSPVTGIAAMLRSRGQ